MGTVHFFPPPKAWRIAVMAFTWDEPFCAIWRKYGLWSEAADGGCWIHEGLFNVLEIVFKFCVPEMWLPEVKIWVPKLIFLDDYLFTVEKNISQIFKVGLFLSFFHCKRRFNVGVESNELGVGRNSLGHFSPTLLTALGLQPCGHNLPSPIR